MFKILIYDIDRRSAARELVLFADRTTHLRGNSWINPNRLVVLHKACGAWQAGETIDKILLILLDMPMFDRWSRIAIEDLTIDRST